MFRERVGLGDALGPNIQGFVGADGRTYVIPPKTPSYSIAPGGRFIYLDPRLLPPIAGGSSGGFNAPHQYISAFPPDYLQTRGLLNRPDESFS